MYFSKRVNKICKRLLSVYSYTMVANEKTQTEVFQLNSIYSARKPSLNFALGRQNYHAVLLTTLIN